MEVEPTIPAGAAGKTGLDRNRPIHGHKIKGERVDALGGIPLDPLVVELRNGGDVVRHEVPAFRET